MPEGCIECGHHFVKVADDGYPLNADGSRWTPENDPIKCPSCGTVQTLEQYYD